MFVFTLLSKLLELLARTDLVGFTFPGLIFTFLSSIPPSPPIILSPIITRSLQPLSYIIFPLYLYETFQDC